jgi:hypothetical protein
MIKQREEAPPISMMEIKRLLKVMQKKHAQMQALAQTPKNHGPAKIKKIRKLVDELDEIIWRTQLDYMPEGKKMRAQLGDFDAILNQTNN